MSDVKTEGNPMFLQAVTMVDQITGVNYIACIPVLEVLQRLQLPLCCFRMEG